MTDRDDELAHLRRTMRSLAEATRAALDAIRWHDHGDGDPPNLPEAGDIDRAIDRFGGVLSDLGVGAPGGAGEGEDGGVRDANA